MPRTTTPKGRQAKATPVVLSPDLVKDLDRFAREAELNRSAIVRMACRQFLSGRRPGPNATV